MTHAQILNPLSPVKIAVNRTSHHPHEILIQFFQTPAELFTESYKIDIAGVPVDRFDNFSDFFIPGGGNGGSSAVHSDKHFRQLQSPRGIGRITCGLYHFFYSRRHFNTVQSPGFTHKGTLPEKKLQGCSRINPENNLPVAASIQIMGTCRIQ
jgi:hypothetical protein